MNRPKLNFLIDAVAFVAFVFLTMTGVLARYVLPPGSGRYAILLGLDRHGWGDLHFWVAVLLLGVLTLHLALHWRWILAMVKGRGSTASSYRVALGVVGLIGLLGLAAAPLLTPVEHTGTPRQGPWLSPSTPTASSPPATLAPNERTTVPQGSSPAEHATPEPAAPDGKAIRGSLSLRQVAESTGIPLTDLIARLGLPLGTDPDQRIGRLRKRYDVSPDDVRQVVRDYLRQPR